MSEPQLLTLKPIGYLKSPYLQKFGTPRQSGLVKSAQAILQFYKDRVPPGSLEGLESFSHLWLIFAFHKNGPMNPKGKVKPPRLAGAKMGVFATRSPHRPNPIGQSLVRIEEINHKENSIRVSGVDVIDQTPILDIKPYISTYDCVASEKSSWPNQTEDKLLEVIWELDPSCLKRVNLTEKEKTFITESLQRDLRNLEDRSSNNPSESYKSLLARFDVTFKYQQNRVVILNIE